MQNRSFFFFFW